MATTEKTIDPILLSEAVGNNRWKYYVYGVVIEAESKEQADQLILQAKKSLEEGEEISDGTWKYADLNVRISAASKQDADRRAMDYFLKRLKQKMEGDDGEKE